MTESRSAADLLPLTQPQTPAQAPASGAPGAGPTPPGAAGVAEGGDGAGAPAFAEVLAARLAGAAGGTASASEPFSDPGSGVTAPATGGTGGPQEAAADADGGNAGADGTATPAAAAAMAPQATAVATQAVAAAPDAEPGAFAHAGTPADADDAARGARERAGGTGPVRTGDQPSRAPAAAGISATPAPGSAPADQEAVLVAADGPARPEAQRHAAREVGKAEAPVRAAELPTHPPHAAQAAPRAAADVPPAAQAERAPLDTATPDWPDTLGERVVWMAGRGGSQHATLRLNPPHLGSVEVRLTVSPQDGQASVSFHVQHPDAREAIQAALPRLREMMAEAGIQLADAQVSHREARDGGAGQERHGRDGASGGDVPSAEAATPATPAPRLARAGLLDLYA